MSNTNQNQNNQLIVSLDVYYGGQFRNQKKDYNFSGAKKNSFENINVGELSLQQLYDFLKENIPYVHTDVYFYEDDYDPEITAKYLTKEEQWTTIKESAVERKDRICLYVQNESEEFLYGCSVEGPSTDESDLYFANDYDTDGKFYSDYSDSSY